MNAKQTATAPAPPSGGVRITHPFHPWFEQEIDVVVRRTHWGEDRVFYRDPDGHVASLPSQWTSLEAADAFVTASAGRSRLRVADLIELVAMLEEFRS